MPAQSDQLFVSGSKVVVIHFLLTEAHQRVQGFNLELGAPKIKHDQWSFRYDVQFGG
jgi:hypothetical protein